MYPIHGGSLYLGQDTNYVHQLWNEIEQNTGILSNQVNPNLWHDVMWEYLAFVDPQKAINLYNSFPNRDLKFGISDAQTYHWLHAMNVLGNVDATLTADHPLAAAFNKNGTVTYVGQNYSATPINITFSDGYVLAVPPHTLATSLDINLSGELASSFSSAYPNGSVDLTATVTGGTPTLVEFYSGDNLIGSTTQAPYVLTAGNLNIGTHNFYAKIYDGNLFNITNTVTVTVGEQIPYLAGPITIPGTFDAAHYDVFQGGVGNGIAYQDLSIVNEGDFRLDEYVDCEALGAEGNSIGWIAGSEWVEYTVDVQQAGNYNLSFRFASGNTAGGGPMRIEADGIVVASGISFNYTGDWYNWQTKNVNTIPLKSGQQILRIYFEGGEFNLGRLTFTYSSPLSYSQPVADAGANQIVVLPQSNVALDGSASNDPNGGNLNYTWTQVYGPSVLTFSNAQAAQPTISTLQEGVYLLKLTVDNGTYSDDDEVYIISSTTNNVPPTVTLQSPLDNSEYGEGELVTLSALADDLNDSVQSVKFYQNNTLIATINQAPYTYNWTDDAGFYTIKAVAFDHNNDSTISNTATIEFTSIDAHQIPGKIEAEDFYFQQGIQLEATTDAGGGQNIGYLDPGDYADYRIDVAQAGTYQVDFRNASAVDNGQLQLQLIDAQGNATTLMTQNFSVTGGWQNWVTNSGMLTLPAGIHTLRLYVVQAPFNVNWMDFTFLTNTNSPEVVENLQVFPNPSADIFNIQGTLERPQDIQLKVLNVQGQVVQQQTLNNTTQLNTQVSLADLPDGFYFLQLQFEDGELFVGKLLKVR